MFCPVAFFCPTTGLGVQGGGRGCLGRGRVQVKGRGGGGRGPPLLSKGEGRGGEQGVQGGDPILANPFLANLVCVMVGPKGGNPKRGPERLPLLEVFSWNFGGVLEAPRPSIVHVWNPLSAAPPPSLNPHPGPSLEGGVCYSCQLLLRPLSLRPSQ